MWEFESLEETVMAIIGIGDHTFHFEMQVTNVYYRVSVGIYSLRAFSIFIVRNKYLTQAYIDAIHKSTWSLHNYLLLWCVQGTWL